MNRIAFIAGLILLSFAAKPQQDKIVGNWLTSEGESQIRIFRATNGKYYGKTYDCYMWFEDDPDILFIKGYVLGMKFLGRQTIWTRELAVRE
jgi:uncharacterized protein (DUF2147 family)